MPPIHRILLVDNSVDYRRSLARLLRGEGHYVVEEATGRQALARLEAESFHLALLDLRLADDNDAYDMSGLEVAREAKARGLPCIIVTAFPSVEAARLALRARGGEALANDFVCKSHGPQALLDAIASTLAQQKEGPTDTAGLVIDTERKLVWRDGAHVHLSSLQYVLLAYLYQHRGTVCSRRELYQAVYGESIPESSLSADGRLERLAARLREKIERDPHHPQYLFTEPGRGFRLDPPS